MIIRRYLLKKWKKYLANIQRWIDPKCISQSPKLFWTVSNGKELDAHGFYLSKVCFFTIPTLAKNPLLMLLRSRLPLFYNFTLLYFAPTILKFRIKFFFILVIIFLIVYSEMNWVCMPMQCTMGLSIALGIWNIWKCKGLVFAQFWSNTH